MGPDGILEVSGRAEGTRFVPPEAKPGTPSLCTPAHGAAVEPMGGTACVLAPELAQGACVPAPGMGRIAATEGVPEFGSTGRAWGPDVV